MRVLVTRETDGRTPEVVSVKRLACRLGRHSWTTRIEAGDEYELCAVCGRTRGGPDSPREATTPGTLDPNPHLERMGRSVGHGDGWKARD